MNHCDYVLTVLKGVVERGDPGAYFGSFVGLSAWVDRAVIRGLVFREGDQVYASSEGLQVYQSSGLERLPHKGRATFWNWSCVSEGEE